MKIKNKQVIFNVLLYITFLVILIGAVLNKEGYNIDEIYTYGLANSYFENPLGLEYEDGIIYEEPAEIWMEYMTVPEWNDFNYGQVWVNQSKDVHPPLYYALVHTISSFVPYSFSVWYAAAVNVAFAIMTLAVVQMLTSLLTENKTVLSMVSVAFVFCAGVISIATFMRMYVMTMFFVTVVTYLVYWMYKKGFSLLGMVGVGIVSVMGTLTHYYFLIYLFFLCLIYGIYLLYKRVWKEVVLFILTMAGAGAVCLGVFPAMWTHIFGGGYRGSASISNFTNTDLRTNLVQLRDFYQLLNKDVFGGFLTFFLIGTLCLWLLNREKYKNDEKEPLFGWLLLLLPSIAYYLIVSRIAVYTTDRYITPIYAVLLTGGIFGFYTVGERLQGKKYVKPVLGTMIILMIAGGFYHCKWPYLEKWKGEFWETAKQYQELDCVYVYEIGWKILPAYQEADIYDSITFISVDDLQELEQVPFDDVTELIMIIESTTDVETALDYMQKRFERLDEYEVIGMQSYTTTYRLY